MSMTNSSKKIVSSIILDLDGTLLNTDGVVTEVLRSLMVKYGKQWDGREALRTVGQTPLEAAAAIVEDYGLPCSTEEFLKEFNPLFSNQ